MDVQGPTWFKLLWLCRGAPCTVAHSLARPDLQRVGMGRALPPFPAPAPAVSQRGRAGAGALAFPREAPESVCVLALDVSFVYPWGRASGEGRRTHRGSVLRRRFEETACEPQFPQALLHSHLVPPGASLLSLGTHSHTCAFLSKQATCSKPDDEAEAEMGRVRAGAGGPAVRPAGCRAEGDGVCLSSGHNGLVRGAVGRAAPVLSAAQGPGVVS